VRACVHETANCRSKTGLNALSNGTRTWPSDHDSFSWLHTLCICSFKLCISVTST